MAVEFVATFEEQNSEIVAVFEAQNREFSAGFEYGGTSFPTYTGSYTVTPSAQTQTLLTADKLLTQNVIINPIPSNYGLITYNGFEIMVS